MPIHALPFKTWRFFSGLPFSSRYPQPVTLMLDWAGRPKALGGKQTGLRFSGRQWKVICFLFFFTFLPTSCFSRALSWVKSLLCSNTPPEGRQERNLTGDEWSCSYVDQLLRLFHTRQPLPLVWIKNVKLHVVAFFCWFFFASFGSFSHFSLWSGSVVLVKWNKTTVNKGHARVLKAIFSHVYLDVFWLIRI